jgi:hypothetical protein
VPEKDPEGSVQARRRGVPNVGAGPGGPERARLERLVRSKGALLLRLEPPKECDLGFPGGFGGYSRFRQYLGPLARALSRGPPSAGSAGSPVPQRGADGSLGVPLLRSSADSKFKGRNGACCFRPAARLTASGPVRRLVRFASRRPCESRTRFRFPLEIGRHCQTEEIR